MSHPHTDDLDPMIADELRRLEAALVDDPRADPALLTLVAHVRDDVPPPRAAFRRELDARAAAGFPAGGGPRAWIPDLRRRASAGPLTFAPALGLAAAVLIALAVSAGVLRDAGSPGPGSTHSTAVTEPAREQAGDAGPAAGTTTSPNAGPGADSAGGAPAPPAQRKAVPSDEALSTPSSSVAPDPGPVPGPPVPRSSETPAFGRKVEQTTRLTLTTSARKLQEVADGIVRVTQSAGGVVEQSNVDATDRGGSATFTLSVPSGKVQETIRRLSALGHVASMNQASTDIPGAFVSVVDRLSDARAERRALLKALDGATTPAGITRLRVRIRVNRAEIASLKGQLNGLRSRADNTILGVTLTARGAGKGPADKEDGDGAWTPGDAAGDALRVLEVAAGVLLIALAVALPLGLLAIPALIGARVTRRRRREQALDPA